MTRIVFEKTECGRCGGSGRYSWNQIHGDRCYGCGGHGMKNTKAGQAAADFYWGIARPAVPVTDLKVGDVVRVRMFGSYRVRTIAAIEEDTLNVGQNRVNLSLAAKDGSVDTRYGTFWTESITLAATVERKAEARDALRASGLPGWEEVAD